VLITSAFGRICATPEAANKNSKALLTNVLPSPTAV
jgi:hypothetical protein